jgi:formylglycine-generating enzyme required for sulfatase activity
MISKNNVTKYQKFCRDYMKNNPNVHGIGIGNKIKDGETLDQISMIFSVEEKKPLAELTEKEIIPSSIDVNDQNFVSDVIQYNRPAKVGCYDWVVGQKIIDGFGTGTNATVEQNTHRVQVRPLVGGISITEQSSLLESIGTLGCLGIDNEDGSVIALTNTHVVCDCDLAPEDQLRIYNFNSSGDPIIQPAYVEPYDGTPGSLPANQLINKIGTVKRFAPTNYDTIYVAGGAANYIDAAVIHIDAGVVDSTSFGILGLTLSNALPFATSEEIDSLRSDNIPLSISSRTTGTKNSTGTNCPIHVVEDNSTALIYLNRCVPSNISLAQVLDEENNDLWLGGQIGIVIYQDLKKFTYDTNANGVSIGGDSGSAVIATFAGGVKKIVGLVFLGESELGRFGYFCRIDKVAEILNVSSWSGTIQHSNPSSWEYLTKPVVIPDPEADPEDLPIKITQNSKDYWRIGTIPLITTTTSSPTTTTTIGPVTTTTSGPTTTQPPIVIGANKANWGTVAIWGLPTNTEPAGFAGGYEMTTVGTNGGPSAYGTYDQTGNVWEWNDLNGTGSFLYRGIRGGGYDSTLPRNLAATTSFANYSSLLTGWPPTNASKYGFRIASYGTLYDPVPDLTNMVMVGDTNNSQDNTGYGSVSNVYWIGKYLVTNDEYCAFLNAVAKADPRQLFNQYMTIVPNPIIRSGTSGNYVYTVRTRIVNSVTASYGNKPVYRVNWFNAARYCNWLHNGKPTGSQNASTTEDGAYTLNGQNSSAAGIGRNPFALYHIPTQNEWYKAAYYKGGGTNAGYWEYATQSNIAPGKVPANNYGDGVI